MPRYAFGYDLRTSISGIGRFDDAGKKLVITACLRHDALGRLALFGWPKYATTLSAGKTYCVQDATVVYPAVRFKYDAKNRRVAKQEVSTVRTPTESNQRRSRAPIGLKSP